MALNLAFLSAMAAIAWQLHSQWANARERDATVIDVHRRHRSLEFRKFLDRIESQVPAELDVPAHRG